jgi:hypothetical protein
MHNRSNPDTTHAEITQKLDNIGLTVFSVTVLLDLSGRMSWILVDRALGAIQPDQLALPVLHP